MTALVAVVGLMPTQTGSPAKATFAGRNGRIAIAVQQGPARLGPSGNAVSDQDLFTVAPNGGALRRITSGVWADGQPAWSPDGHKIAFQRIDPLGEIYLVNSDGTGLRNLSNTPAFIEQQPAWSPDGEKIVFSRLVPSPSVEDGHDLYVMDLESGDVVQLTSSPGPDLAAEWSPDGHWIAFSDQAGIGLIRPDGSGRRVLVGMAAATGPSWSPDGRKIVFALFSSVGSPAYVVNLDGSGLRRLTSKDDGTIAWPVWSPDGRWITFISDRDGAWKLYKMRPDGSNVRRLMELDLESTNHRPDWGPRP